MTALLRSLLAVTLLLPLAGCGGSDGDDAPGGNGHSAPDTPRTNVLPDITIGRADIPKRDCRFLYSDFLNKYSYQASPDAGDMPKPRFADFTKEEADRFVLDRLRENFRTDLSDLTGVETRELRLPDDTGVERLAGWEVRLYQLYRGAKIDVGDGRTPLLAGVEARLEDTGAGPVVVIGASLWTVLGAPEYTAGEIMPENAVRELLMDEFKKTYPVTERDFTRFELVYMLRRDPTGDRWVPTYRARISGPEPAAPGNAAGPLPAPERIEHDFILDAKTGYLVLNRRYRIGQPAEGDPAFAQDGISGASKIIR